GMKSKDELAKWGDEVVVFESGNPPKDYVALIEKGYERALAAIGSGDYDLVVLDEYNMALFFELISWDKTKALLDARHPETDLVTEMKEVKHYYLQGVMARKGIEN
ncbi:MAG: cob(I)yrinic acid a,c-diamide adenosyltransferase, partial [Veillonella sp.]|nr:cob(I)yrinic acid a,c-diamide adenosyltransferase [Veillonella sp.]